MTAAAPRLPDMAAPGVQTLLGAVRRHLWLRQVAAAVRVSAWVSAAATLLAAAVHGAVRPVPLDAVAVAVGLLWCLMLARTAWRLPADGACALWADQHLGGESAFTTWLDTRRDAPGRGPAANPAVRWLESWAAARAPISLRALAARRDPTHLARPLLTLAVCGALASFVLGLPGLSPTPLQPAAAAAAATAPESALGLGDAAEPAARAGEIAAALRAAPASDREVR